MSTQQPPIQSTICKTQSRREFASLSEESVIRADICDEEIAFLIDDVLRQQEEGVDLDAEYTGDLVQHRDDTMLLGGSFYCTRTTTPSSTGEESRRPVPTPPLLSSAQPDSPPSTLGLLSLSRFSSPPHFPPTLPGGPSPSANKPVTPLPMPASGTKKRRRRDNRPAHARKRRKTALAVIPDTPQSDPVAPQSTPVSQPPNQGRSHSKNSRAHRYNREKKRRMREAMGGATVGDDRSHTA